MTSTSQAATTAEPVTTKTSHQTTRGILGSSSMCHRVWQGQALEVPNAAAVLKLLALKTASTSDALRWLGTILPTSKDQVATMAHMEISHEQRAASADRILDIHAELEGLEQSRVRDRARGQQLEKELRCLGVIRWLSGGPSQPR